MIELSKGGAYLVDGVDVIEESAAQQGALAARLGTDAPSKEEAAKKTAGVKDAVVNFMTLKMNVEFEDGADVKAVMQDVLKNCKKVEDDCEIYI